MALIKTPRFLRALIFPIATYGCESWTINKTSERKINAFELKCYRTILRMPWTEKRTNNSILQELNIKEGWLLSTIIKRKLKYFGHVKRHEGLMKEILEGQVQGKRTRGRPRRRWSQDITERMKTTITRAGRIAQDRTAYREAVIDVTCHKGHATWLLLILLPRHPHIFVMGTIKTTNQVLEAGVLETCYMYTCICTWVQAARGKAELVISKWVPILSSIWTRVLIFLGIRHCEVVCHCFPRRLFFRRV